MTFLIHPDATSIISFAYLFVLFTYTFFLFTLTFQNCFLFLSQVLACSSSNGKNQPAHDSTIIDPDLSAKANIIHKLNDSRLAPAQSTVFSSLSHYYFLSIVLFQSIHHIPMISTSSNIVLLIYSFVTDKESPNHILPHENKLLKKSFHQW